jgi:hypothetical protein
LSKCDTVAAGAAGAGVGGTGAWAGTGTGAGARVSKVVAGRATEADMEAVAVEYAKEASRLEAVVEASR